MSNRARSGFGSEPFRAPAPHNDGAGDHYNAGFCLGLLCQASLGVSVGAGLATAGRYIRTGFSPALAEL